MPSVLSTVVQDLVAEQPGLEVADDLDADVIKAAQHHQPDVLVALAPALSAPEVRERLWHINPRLRLVAISEDGRFATLHGLVPRRITLHDVSPQELRSAILGWLPHESQWS